MAPKSPFRFGRPLLVLVLLAAVGVGLVAAFNPQRRARVHLERGKLYLRQDRTDAALAELERSRELAPPGWEAQYYIAEALAARGAGADAVAQWRALRHTPEGFRALAAAAEQARRDGDVATARAIVAEAQEDGLSLVPFLAVEARILHAEGRLADAAARYRKALALNPRRVDLAVELSDAFGRAGQVDEAERVLVDTLAVVPDATPVEIQLAEIYKRRGRTADALALYRRVVAREPDMIAARVALLHLLILTDAWDEVETHANALLEQPGGAGIAHFALGRRAFRKGDYRAAVDHLKLAKTDLPRDATVWLWLGRAQLQRGETDAALVSLRGAAARQAENADVQLELLRALWKAGEFTEARERAETFPGEPADAEARTFLATIRASAGDRLEQLDLSGLLRRAQDALRAGRMDEARRAATLAQHRAPEDPRPFIALALLAIARQDVRAALGYLHEGATRDPGNATVAVNRARLLDGLGRRNLAIATLTRALTAGGGDADALLNEVVPLLLAEARGAEVEALLRTHAAMPLSDAMAAALGEALLLQNRPDEALRAVAEHSTLAAKLCTLRALFVLRRDAEARAALTDLAETGSRPELDAMRTWLLGDDAPSPPRRQRVGDHPIARAVALAAGRRDLAGRVAEESGRLGALLELVALVEAGEANVGAWQADHVGVGPPPSPEDLPPNRRAFRSALLCQLMEWPAVALRFYTDAGATAYPYFLEPVLECAMRLGRTDQARRLAERATASPAPLVRIRVRHATLLARNGDDAGARAVVLRSLEVAPDSAPLLTLAGRLAERAGETAAAISRYRAALAAGAGAETRNNLAWLLAQDDATLVEALELAAAAQADAPFTPGILDTLAWCYLQSGQPDQAAYFSNLAVLLDPEDGRIRAHRAEAFFAGGWPEAARADCAILRDLGVLDQQEGLTRICAQVGA